MIFTDKHNDAYEKMLLEATRPLADRKYDERTSYDDSKVDRVHAKKLAAEVLIPKSEKELAPTVKYLKGKKEKGKYDENGAKFQMAKHVANAHKRLTQYGEVSKKLDPHTKKFAARLALKGLSRSGKLKEEVIVKTIQETLIEQRFDFADIKAIMMNEEFINTTKEFVSENIKSEKDIKEVVKQIVKDLK